MCSDIKSSARPAKKEGRMGYQTDLYGTTYQGFQSSVRKAIRIETYGEDLGQTGWTTSNELSKFLQWLKLDARSRVLDVGTGAGGLAIRTAQLANCHVTGIDVSELAIENAVGLANTFHIEDQVQFWCTDAEYVLPFQQQSFDCILCIDALNHLTNHKAAFADWHRLLSNRGQILLTDQVLTGLITNEEFVERTSIGRFVVGPKEADMILLEQSGFKLLHCEDITEGVEEIAERWRNARSKYKVELIELEGADTYERVQRFLKATFKLANGRSMSRLALVAVKE